jgi:hypothetical protein
LTSNAQPIVRTALANAESVKSITVETYDAHLLANRILTTSQLGILTESGVLERGFDIQDALPGGNFSGSCDMGCAGYFTARDWIANIPSEDLDNFNNQIGTSGLTRSQISNLLTAKFVYDAGRPSDSRWKLIVYIGSENILSFSGSTDPNEGTEGTILGFDGNAGYFMPYGSGPNSIVFFSVDGSLQNNSSVGSLTPYGDQVSRLVPIRNFFEMWTYSDVPYTEDTP